jgi:hypothetical protein
MYLGENYTKYHYEFERIFLESVSPHRPRVIYNPNSVFLYKLLCTKKFRPYGEANLWTFQIVSFIFYSSTLHERLLENFKSVFKSILSNISFGTLSTASLKYQLFKAKYNPHPYFKLRNAQCTLQRFALGQCYYILENNLCRNLDGKKSV